MNYKRLLELAEYGSWKKVMEADAEHHALFMRSLHEVVDVKELERLENDLDRALDEHGALRRLIDALKSF